jgi:hypothetical protein
VEPLVYRPFARAHIGGLGGKKEPDAGSGHPTPAVYQIRLYLPSARAAVNRFFPFGILRPSLATRGSSNLCHSGGTSVWIGGRQNDPRVDNCPFNTTFSKHQQPAAPSHHSISALLKFRWAWVGLAKRPVADPATAHAAQQTKLLTAVPRL